mmetsp:Transcript_11092/g.23263  ORF Transcript_11092/g.23263 Transcript_11092/m.23263 type:complete len:103 (+) Transcript_11092:151-459(+)
MAALVGVQVLKRWRKAHLVRCACRLVLWCADFPTSQLRANREHKKKFRAAISSAKRTLARSRIISKKRNDFERIQETKNGSTEKNPTGEHFAFILQQRASLM